MVRLWGLFLNIFLCAYIITAFVLMVLPVVRLSNQSLQLN